MDKGQLILVTFVLSLVLVLGMCFVVWGVWRILELMLEGNDPELLPPPDRACDRGDPK